MDEGSVLRASHDDAGGEFDDGAAGGWEPQVLSGADANGSGDRDADGAADGAADWAGGWFRDPTRHHELRYRDESGWTQRVSNFGVEGLDPYWAPPGWYRDPSRRARHRYWGDDGWTAKTAAKGFRLHDPVDAAWPPPHPGHGRNDLTLTPKLPDPPRNESGSVAVPPPIRRALGIDDADDVGHWSYRWPGGRWPAWPPPHPGHGRNDLTLTPKLPDPPRNESGSVAVPPPIRRALGIDDANDVGHWSYRWPGRRW